MNLKEIEYSQFLDLLEYKFKDESQMLAKIEETGKIFNHYRENLHLYRNDKALISAYCVYYLTTNLPKLRAVIDMLPSGSIDFSEYDEIVDIGTGPGTFLLALSEFVTKEQSVLGIDISVDMLSQAQKICSHFIGDYNISYSTKYVDRKAKNKLVLFTHSLNEMEVNQAIDYIDQIKPSKILFIEPGTKELFEKIIALRSTLTKNYEVLFPCKDNSVCPLDKQIDWCHQYIMVKHSKEVERMTQKLSRNRRLLPLTIQLYSLEKQTLKRKMATLIRVNRPSKFALNWQVCLNQDGKHIIKDFEIMLKPYSKSEKKVLHDICSGHEFDYEVEKELGDGRVRALLNV